MVRKIGNNSGETITEVLVAALVVSLAVVLFSMMVTSSFRIITTSETAIHRLYQLESNIEAGNHDDFSRSGGSLDTGGKNLAAAGDLSETSVSVYTSESVKFYEK